MIPPGSYYRFIKTFLKSKSENARISKNALTLITTTTEWHVANYLDLTAEIMKNSKQPKTMTTKDLSIAVLPSKGYGKYPSLTLA